MSHLGDFEHHVKIFLGDYSISPVFGWCSIRTFTSPCYCPANYHSYGTSPFPIGKPSRNGPCLPQQAVELQEGHVSPLYTNLWCTHRHVWSLMIVIPISQFTHTYIYIYYIYICIYNKYNHKGRLEGDGERKSARERERELLNKHCGFRYIFRLCFKDIQDIADSWPCRRPWGTQAVRRLFAAWHHQGGEHIPWGFPSDSMGS